MFSYISKRLLLMVPTLFGVMLVTFLVTQFVPGGPVEQLVSQLRVDGHIEIGASQVAAVEFIPEVYERRDYIPAWVSDASVDAVLEAIRNSYEQGLNPEDYHWQAIKELRRRVAAGAGSKLRQGLAR